MANRGHPDLGLPNTQSDQLSTTQPASENGFPTCFISFLKSELCK
ncbi:MAG: hypothetical protein ACJAW0_000809 [Zhongshania sp.]